jgi:hypothetical protein
MTQIGRTATFTVTIDYALSATFISGDVAKKAWSASALKAALILIIGPPFAECAGTVYNLISSHRLGARGIHHARPAIDPLQLID